MSEGESDWYLYVLVSEDGKRTYVGVSLDPRRRLLEHNGERPGGAKSTRGGRPWTVGTTYGPYPDRASVQRAEHALKKLRGRARLSWEADLEGPPQ